jgi:hypothetical protein
MVRGRVLTLMAALIAGSSAQALAVTPKLSGTYLSTESKTCQAILEPVTDLAVIGVVLENVFTPKEFASVGTAPFVVDLNADTGSLNRSVGLVTFSGGSVSGTTTEGKGSLVDYNGLGQPITGSTSAVSGSFSLSGTSLTINGTTYKAFVGGVKSTGVASIVRAINVTPPCVVRLDLDHQ